MKILPGRVESFESGIHSQTHSGVRQMFGLHFVKSGLIDKEAGKFYTDIFDMSKQEIAMTILTSRRKMFWI